MAEDNIVKKVCKELEHFDDWNVVKKRAHISHNDVGFKERDIFWLRLGQNIRSEEFGKGNEYQRPIVVVKKLTHDIFFGIPLSSVIKDGDYFYTFTYIDKRGKKRTNSAMILQLRVFDKKRLMGRIGMMPKEDFNALMKKISKLFIPPQNEAGLPVG